MHATIYAAEPTAAEDALTAVTDWIQANTNLSWAIGGTAALVLFTLGTYLAVTALKGRDNRFKATVGYAVVQIGMAYVTITGGYDFWHLVAHMPPAEAAALAVFIEAAQWYAIGKAFEWMAQHTEGTPHIGYGRPGMYFWLFVSGGSLIAVLGAFWGQHNGPLAIGRTVAVVIGSLLWDLLLREKMHRDETIPPTVLLLTWRKVGIRLGILAAEAKDNVTQDREWTLRRMSRALRWKNEGVRLFRWLGERYLMRAMDAGNASLLAQAAQRYAMNYVLRTEVTAGHKTMDASLTAARRILEGEVVMPPPPPVEQPQPTKRIILPPPVRPRPRLQQDAPQESMASAAALRDEARQWAAAQIKAGVNLTGAAVADHFSRKEEWGRLRLREAEAELSQGEAA